MLRLLFIHRFFFFNATATTEIYTLSLHDALPIYHCFSRVSAVIERTRLQHPMAFVFRAFGRSEEHTSELQSLRHLVCRLLLEKKKNKTKRSSVVVRLHNTNEQLEL